jgi:3-oxoacyl-(acyl-carrier-protein) synthase
MARRVWVTGVGAISAGGLGRSALRQLLLERRSGIQVLRSLGDLPAGVAPTPAASPHTRRLDRAASLFFGAAQEAWQDARLDCAPRAPARTAVIEGSSLGPLADILSCHSRRVTAGDAEPVRPSSLVRFMAGAGGAAFAHAYCIHGPVLHLSAGSVSGMTAIGEAWRRIASGEMDLAVAGGAECPLHAELVAHFRAAGILAARDGTAERCRPFDRCRSGTVLGEGAGVLILESEESARGRGVPARAIVRGYGFACEAHSLTSPDPTGAGVSAAVREALRDVPTREVGWIKAHGTGTRLNDLAECRGLSTIFGGRLPTIPLTSLKPALGHALGASGALETVAVALALEAGVVPATLETEEIDPELPACSVALQVTPSRGRVALALAEGFGGRCGTLAIEGVAAATTAQGTR